MTTGSSSTPQDPRGKRKKIHNTFSDVFGLNGHHRSKSRAYVPQHFPVEERFPVLADIVVCLAHVIEEYFVADDLTVANDNLEVYKPFHDEKIS
jgi:hypothetical protein